MDSPHKHTARMPRRRSMIGEILKYTILSLIIVAPLRIYVAQPFIVSGESMLNTLKPNEYLVVDQLTYRRQAPQRGDVVIFRYPLDTSVYFVKRVIGLPNETLHIERGVVTITSPDSKQPIRLDEPYVSTLTQDPPTDITLASDEYFVMGDNRNGSSDSRTWGPLARKYIVGRAFLRIFPLTRIAYLPGQYRYTD